MPTDAPTWDETTEQKTPAWDETKPVADTLPSAPKTPAIDYNQLMSGELSFPTTGEIKTGKDVDTQAGAIDRKYQFLAGGSNPEEAKATWSREMADLEKRAKTAGIPFSVAKSDDQMLAEKVQSAQLTPEEMSALVGPKAAKVLTPLERGVAGGAGGLADPQNILYAPVAEPRLAATVGKGIAAAMLAQGGVEEAKAVKDIAQGNVAQGVEQAVTAAPALIFGAAGVRSGAKPVAPEFQGPPAIGSILKTPEGATPKEPYASRIETPTEVHGAVQPQPVPGPGEVPVEESGPGIQPQTTGRVPETPASEVPLTKTRISHNPDYVILNNKLVKINETKPVAEKSGLTPMMDQYRRIKDELTKQGHGDALLAFRLGDFYEFFFDDAKTAAEKLKIAVTKRQDVPMSGIPYHAAQTYFKKLTDAGHRVAVVDAVGESKSGKPVERGVPTILGKQPETPAQATEKVAEHVDEVKRTEGQRPAKEIKTELVQRLEKAIAQAPAITKEQQAALDVEPQLTRLRDFQGEGGTALQASKKSQAENAIRRATWVESVKKTGLKQIEIDIPGDGKFTIWNTKEALAEVLKRAKRLSVSSTEPAKTVSHGISKEDREWIAANKQTVAPGEDRVLGFGGGIKKHIPTIAATPQQLKTMVQAMTPGLSVVGKSKQGLQSLLLPTAKGPAHLSAAETLGAKLGAMNQRQESTAHALRPAGKAFDRLGVHNEKLPPGKNPGIQFMSDMSQGRPMTAPMQAIADQIQKLFGERLQKLEEAGAPLQTVRDNYFPGMWTRESREAFNAALEQAHTQGIIPKDVDVNSATPQQKAWVKTRVDELLKAGTGSETDMLSFFTRTPLKGKESFRKQKVFDDIMTAAEFGLRPISNNPIDLVKGKMAEMDKSIMANQFFQSLKEQGKLKIINPYEEVPSGWVRLNDKYGTIYGKPTVTVPEHVDQAVYEGLLNFAGKLGIRHERSMKFPPGPGTRALGLSYQGQDLVRTRFATETSVLAHEIGHQLDYRYNLWNKIVTDAIGLGKRGTQTKGASQAMRGQIKKELRAIADMTGSRGGDPRSKVEQIAQMVEAYVHAPDEMKLQAPTVFKSFDHFIQTNPKVAGLADIRPGIALTKLTGEQYVGLPIMGYRIVPEAVGDIANNYLSSSLYNNKYFGNLYKAWMGSANALNQSQLGLGSAFHAGFTTGDVQISAGANLIKDIYGLARGNRSLTELADTGKTWVASSIKTAMTGSKVLNAWRNPDGVIDPRIKQVVEATELAGGGYKMEHGLQTEQTTQMVRDWFSGHPVKAALRSSIALTELMAKPIMDFLVPRQKAGVFSELAWRVIEQNPGKPLEELTPQFRQAWNRVDARLGQVRYNRIFANNTAKNIVQGVVRAPGWTGGTIAEIGGAFPDAYRFFKEWIDTGKPPQNIPDRVAYTMSLLMTVAVANAALTYAFTGQTPQGMDFFAFRTGRKDKDGNDERFLLPTYVKDMVAYAKQPLVTLGHKTHPLLSMFNDVYQNRDFYGYEIRNPNAGAGTQASQVAKYVVKSFEPFWTRGERKMMEAGANPGRIIAPYVGIMPAPAYVTRSKIQNEISELYHLRTGDRLKPYDSRTADETKRAARDSSTMDVYMFKHLPQSDKDALLKKMTPEETHRYQ